VAHQTVDAFNISGHLAELSGQHDFFEVRQYFWTPHFVNRRILLAEVQSSDFPPGHDKRAAQFVMGAFQFRQVRCA
jgi:hypothetical protein